MSDDSCSIKNTNRSPRTRHTYSDRPLYPSCMSTMPTKYMKGLTNTQAYITLDLCMNITLLEPILRPVLDQRTQTYSTIVVRLHHCCVAQKAASASGICRISCARRGLSDGTDTGLVPGYVSRGLAGCLTGPESSQARLSVPSNQHIFASAYLRINRISRPEL